MKRHACSTIVLAIAFGLLGTAPAGAQRRPVTEKDLF